MAEIPTSSIDALSSLDNYDFSGVDLSFLHNIDPHVVIRDSKSEKIRKCKYCKRHTKSVEDCKCTTSLRKEQSGD